MSVHQLAVPPPSYAGGEGRLHGYNVDNNNDVELPPYSKESSTLYPLLRANDSKQPPIYRNSNDVATASVDLEQHAEVEAAPAAAVQVARGNHSTLRRRRKRCTLVTVTILVCLIIVMIAMFGFVHAVFK